MSQYQQYSQEQRERSGDYAGGYTPGTYETQYNPYEQPVVESPYQQALPPLNEPRGGLANSQHNHSSSFLDTDSCILAGLSYFGLWLTGLLFLIFGARNRLIRFHAIQSTLFFGVVNVLYIFFITIMVHHVPFIWGFAIFAFVLMNIIALIGWVYGMVGAFSGKYVKLPFVGDMAERYINQGPQLK